MAIEEAHAAQLGDGRAGASCRRDATSSLAAWCSIASTRLKVSWPRASICSASPASRPEFLERPHLRDVTPLPASLKIRLSFCSSPTPAHRDAAHAVLRHQRALGGTGSLASRRR